MKTMPVWFHGGDGWLARLVLQRGLGAVYLIAFIVALTQFRPLLGERGLLPVPRFIERTPFRFSPSLFYFGYSDRFLMAVAGAGVLLSSAVVLGLPDLIAGSVALNIAVWLALWLLYLSIVNVGQRFYGFGWETLILEAGFLAAFLGPAWTAVPMPILWAFRWLLVRLELGAGLIKMRGDKCWRDCTCLDYHHETQPLPNPLSWFFHRLPKPFHRVEVLGSHFAQLVAPFMLFLPQPFATIGGLVIAVTQSWLVLSGNFSWLNVTTIVLAASALSDSLLGVETPPLTIAPAQDSIVAVVAVAVLVLSYNPLRNMLSSEQRMNASFDPVHLVNTYGAFGSVTKIRNEVVIEGSDAQDDWREYEFRGKPSDPNKRPRQFAPFHLRLDWMMWFAGLSPMREMQWLDRLLRKLLENDAATLRLIGQSPFGDRAPTAVRVVMYRYRFTTWAERRETGAWWVRSNRREIIPPRKLKDYRPEAEAA
jgi:hypothetical protein